MNPGVKEDKWFRTTCTGCYGNCAVRVRRLDGVVVKIEGDPDSVLGSQGGVCGKASSLIQQLYHPRRINYPLKRTNPSKGIGIDPKWKRISWDEALGETAERLKKVRAENPNKLVMIFSPSSYGVRCGVISALFSAVFGGSYSMMGMSVMCGNAAHFVAGMNHCSWSVIPDYDLCNYWIQFGSNKGVGSGHSAGIAMLKSANARARSAQMVAFDPMCNFAGGKAREWVPILPGTDGAVALAMANVMVNELKTYDMEYLKHKTNAPYLVKPDSRYARDEAKGEPLIWDIAAGGAKMWNEPIGDPALEGSYEVQGIKCQTVFSLLKEHLRQYTPEWAEGISTVPAGTIHRVATEFVTNARIGSTIDIQGVKLPYRPVAAIQFRGGQGHTNGVHSYMAVDLLNQLVGACEVPGGALSWAVRSLGYPGTGYPKFTPFASKDGFLRLTAWMPTVGAWPHPEPRVPVKRDLSDLFTASAVPAIGGQSDIEDTWRKFGLDAWAVALIDSSNCLMTCTNPELMMRRFREMFVAQSAIVPTETSEACADIVFPDCYNLEFDDFSDSEGYHFNYPMGMLDWEYHPRLKVVEPTHERRFVGDVWMELAERVGIRNAYNAAIIGYLRQTNCPPPFAPEERLSWSEMTDRVLQARFGPEHNLEWFREHGFIRWPKRVEEAYWRWFVDARSSIYSEWLIDHAEQLKAICEPRDFHLDWKQYTPHVTYFPAIIHKEDRDPKYDLIAFSYRDILHGASSTQDLPWLFEASEMSPFTFDTCMNRKAAQEKGIKDGDSVYVENPIGNRIKVKIHLIEGIHPQTIAITCGSGHWLEGHRAKDRGGHLNTILESDLEHHCPISQNIETAQRVRVYKAED